MNEQRFQITYNDLKSLTAATKGKGSVLQSILLTNKQ